MAIHDELIPPEPPLKASMPVPSAEIHPGLIPLIVRDFGTEIVVNARGGHSRSSNGYRSWRN